MVFFANVRRRRQGLRHPGSRSSGRREGRYGQPAHPRALPVSLRRSWRSSAETSTRYPLARHAGARPWEGGPFRLALDMAAVSSSTPSARPIGGRCATTCGVADWSITAVGSWVSRTRRTARDRPPPTAGGRGCALAGWGKARPDRRGRTSPRRARRRLAGRPRRPARSILVRPWPNGWVQAAGRAMMTGTWLISGISWLPGAVYPRCAERNRSASPVVPRTWPSPAGRRTTRGPRGADAGGRRRRHHPVRHGPLRPAGLGALMSAGNLSRWHAPHHVSTVLIAGDRGEAGEIAAMQLARRLERDGVEAIVRLPKR